MGRGRESRKFLLATGLSGSALGLFSIFVGFILGMMGVGNAVFVGFFVALGLFLGMVSWSAVVGGVAPYLLFMMPWDTALSVPALPAVFIAIGGGVGVLLQRKVMARHR